MSSMRTTAAGASVVLKEIWFAPPPEGAAAATGEARGKVLMEFVDPAASVALGRDGALAEIGAGEERSGAEAADLLVLMVPGGTADFGNWQRKAREWVEAGDGSRGGAAPVKIVVDEEAWILWRPGRAVVSGPAGLMEPLRDAVVEFGYYERELRKLEGEIAGDWQLAEKHMPLIHEANTAALKAAGDLGSATGRAMMRRMRFARLEPHLYGAPDSYRGGARVAARRLRARSEVERRLEAADAQIEVFEDIYDMANQRGGEHVNFVREYRLEWAILIVLMAETALMVWDVYLNYMSYYH